MDETNDMAPTSLATRPLHSGVVLRSTDDAMGLAHSLIRGGLLPKHIKSPADAVMIMLTGSELGLGPMASLRGMHCIEGKVTLSSEMMLSIVASRGVVFRWVEASATAATIEMRRPGFEPHTQSFTIEEAKAASLTGKDNWKKYPAAMLRARATSAACRAYCPDLLAGGGLYTPDEVESMETIEVSRREKPKAATDEEVAAVCAALATGEDDAVERARELFKRSTAEQQATITKAVKDATKTEAAGEAGCGADDA